MANTNAYIDRIQVPNGSNTITNYLVDNVSGYGKKTLVIHLTSGGDGSFQSDVSYNEILAAYEDCRNLIVLDESDILQESVKIFAPLTSYVDYTFYFERLASRNSTLNTSGIGSYYRYSIDPGNAPSTSALIAGEEVRGVPFASSSNNGKVLKVVNGNWEPANESAGGTQVSIIRYIDTTPSDLTGTTWQFNSYVDMSATYNYTINFISNSTTYDHIWSTFTYGASLINYGSWTTAYNGGWVNQSYRTISITGGEDATNQNLISYLEANATRIS